MTTDKKAAVGRREFLRGLGVGAAAAGATVAAPLVGEARADSESNDERRKARYNSESPDIKAYYRVNSYPR